MARLFFFLAAALAILAGAELLMRGDLAANVGLGALCAGLALIGAGFHAGSIADIKKELREARRKDKSGRD